MFDLSALDTPRLTGRGDLQQSLRPHLEGGVLLTSRRGSVGYGATSMARRLAKEAEPDFPDGCIEINLRGSVPGNYAQPTATSIHRRVAVMLDQNTSLPEDERALRKHYQAILAQHKIVLILDDVASSSQLRPLLPRKGSTVIVTSQVDLASSFPRLHAAYIGELTPNDAVQLMSQGAPEITNLPRQAMRRISERLESNPLALRIIAPLLGAPHGLTPKNLVRALESAYRRIVALRGSPSPNTPIDVAIETSYEALPPDLRQHFEALAIFPAPFGESAAAAVWKIPAAEARESLGVLAGMALVDRLADSGLYEVHQRVRTFTQEFLLGQSQRSEELVARYVGHYLRGAIQVSAALSVPSPRGLPRNMSPYPFWDHIPIAWHRLNGEAPGWPKPPGMDRWIREFPLHGRTLLNVLLSRAEYRDWLSRSLSTTEGTEAARLQCALLGALGQTQAEMAQHHDAIVSFERQAKVARDCEAQDYEAEALMFAGTSHGALGELQRAESSWRRAIELFELLGDARAQEIHPWLSQLRESI